MGTYNIRKGDRDCSASVIDSLRTAGIPVGNASYTGDMRNEFLKTGQWEWKPMSYTAHRGDVYLAEGHHTAMCSYPLKGKDSPDKLLEFSHNEKGGYYNGKVGDQLNDSGYAAESHERPYYDYPWNGILHYKGERMDLLEDAVQIMEHLVRCPEHGYTMSSPGRTGSSGYCVVNTTGTGDSYTGWKKIDNKWYYFQHGVMLKSKWIQDNRVWYYLGADGVMYSNKWLLHKDNWYFLTSDGSMAKGWVAWKSKIYYCRPAAEGDYPEGSMYVGPHSISAEYEFDESGALTKSYLE